MKLNETQIKAIDLVLEQSGVVYIDYKYEILDHIAIDIEEVMETYSFTFETAFEIILKKWQPKLKKSKGATFGYIWELPAILEQKAKKIYWRKNIILIIFSLILTAILLYFRDFVKVISGTISYLLMIILLIQFIGYLKIRLSKKKSTFGFLYKQQFFTQLISYLIAVINLNSSHLIFEKSTFTIFPILLLVSMTLIAPILSFSFYKKHFEQLKRSRILSN